MPRGNPWTQVEDDKLREAVKIMGVKDWKVRARFLLHDTSTCDPQIQKLSDLHFAGERDATQVCRSDSANHKFADYCFLTCLQCAHRWTKVLSPDLVKGPWQKTEDEIIKKVGRALKTAPLLTFVAAVQS